MTGSYALPIINICIGGFRRKPLTIHAIDEDMMATHREEDYLEAILHIVGKKGYARVGDISKHLDCSAATVTEMFGRLSRNGMVNYEKYGGVTLTEKGKKIGVEVDRKHGILKDFFMMLGVKEETADLDACEVEHSIHPETMRRLSSILKLMQDDSELRKRIRQHLDE
jgi:DtxR family Mn-dependent transcriptional regulator